MDKKEIKESKFYKTVSKVWDNKIGKAVSKVWNNKFFSIVWIRLGFLALFINLFIEILSRHSFPKGIVYLFKHPLAFAFNSLIIFFTLSFTALFRKRIFVGALISAVWLGFVITNFIIRGSRKTPFTAPDFYNITEGLNVVKQYFSLFHIILVIVLIVMAVAAIVFIGIKSPKYKGKMNYLLAGFISAVSFGVIMLGNFIGNISGLLPRNFGNIVQAYDKYGFCYCFSNSVFNMGIDKPKDYSSEKIDSVLDDVDDKVDSDLNDNNELDPDSEHPNIIFLQLESFFDPTLVEGLEFSEDPIPNFRKLYEDYSSGFLSVPSFGAGTANTEFEIITGMNLDDFGPGEYPYKTVLRNNACESICYYLEDYGYNSVALHNNEGDFYTRNTVFSRLGFNAFVSIEYFDKVKRNPTGWVKDDCLIDEILGILESSKQQDFIYGISVQGHGDYPEDTGDMDLKITVSNNNKTGNPNGFEYYVNQIHEMDKFIADLIKELEKLDEKTVLVMYGDHLPTFDFTDDMLDNGDIYQTQYVIWDNCGLKVKDRDVQSYQLNTLVISRLGMVGGAISKLQLTSASSEDKETYLNNLRLLEYDLLYGNCEAYDGVNPFRITNMKMGYKTIRINNAYNVYSHVEIYGENFTEYSTVEINGKDYHTIYNGPRELWIDACELKDGDEINIIQYSDNGNELSRSTVFIYKER